MLYYNTNNNKVYTVKQLRQEKYPVTSIQALNKKGIYELQIEKIDYNSEIEGIIKDGYPLPSHTDKSIFIQRMKKFNRLEKQRSDLLVELKQLRKHKETQVVTMPNGVQVDASRESRNMILQTMTCMPLANLETVPFNAENGWYELTLEDLQAVSTFLTLHVEACFKHCKYLEEKIMECNSLQELNEIDITHGWPNEPESLSTDDEIDNENTEQEDMSLNE